jgi:hypothetical protein
MTTWTDPLDSFNGSAFTQPGSSGFGPMNWSPAVDWRRVMGAHASVFNVTNPNNVMSNIAVQASLDGSTWFTISTGTANSTGVIFLAPAGAPEPARYVRAGIALDGPGSDTVTLTVQHVAQETP